MFSLAIRSISSPIPQEHAGSEVSLTTMLEICDIIGILLDFLNPDIAGNASPGQFVAEEERVQSGHDSGLAKREKLLMIDSAGQFKAEPRRRLPGRQRHAGHRIVG